MIPRRGETPPAAPRRTVALMLSLWVCLAAPGCTNRAWFEGFKAAQRQQCYRKLNQEEVRQCVDRVNGQTYDDYKRAREESGKEDKGDK